MATLEEKFIDITERQKDCPEYDDMFKVSDSYLHCNIKKLSGTAEYFKIQLSNLFGSIFAEYGEVDFSALLVPTTVRTRSGEISVRPSGDLRSVKVRGPEDFFMRKGISDFTFVAAVKEMCGRSVTTRGGESMPGLLSELHQGAIKNPDGSFTRIILFSVPVETVDVMFGTGQPVRSLPAAVARRRPDSRKPVRVCAGEDFLREFLLPANPTAEDFKIYILELLQFFVKEEDGRQRIDFDSLSRTNTLGTEWGEVRIKRLDEDSSLNPYSFIFTVPQTFFSRGDASMDHDAICSAFDDLSTYSFEIYSSDDDGEEWRYTKFTEAFNAVTYKEEKEGEQSFVSFMMSAQLMRFILGGPDCLQSFDGSVALRIRDVYAKRLYQVLCYRGTGERLTVTPKAFFEWFAHSWPDEKTFERDGIPSILDSLREDAGMEVSFSRGPIRKKGKREFFTFTVVRNDNIGHFAK